MIRVSSFGVLNDPWRDDLIQRTKRLIPFSWTELPVKRLPGKRPKTLLPEEKKFLDKTTSFWILDQSGKSFDSDSFYEFCFKNSELHLVVGPAFGFHEDFFERSQGKVKISDLTLTHRLAQVVLAESLYRSACQLKNHPFVK